MVAPLFILAPHRSFTSVVCTMIGQHPQMYGLPEMNLFVAESMEEWWANYRRGRHFEAHGLLRAVAHMYFGKQTEETIELARRWLWRRLELGTGDVFRELTERVHPQIMVDKSPNTVNRAVYLQRLRKTFPKAKFLHLLRHPRGHGESVTSLLRNVFKNSEDPDAQIFARRDPQKRWHVIHSRICAFLATVPEGQQMRLRGEDLLADPDRYLRQIAAWLEVSTGEASIEEMKHPERSPFACFGPANARLGNDPQLLKQPVLRPDRARPQSLDGPLSWRPDGSEFSTEVKHLAISFGYE
ncbi:MAG TPA: sulfotransferase [Pyrinomonadaceae bacterium]|jgi:hypothetical protein|nr:sulfotransferase [Pyrinomonadaceae bacterium]